MQLPLDIRFRNMERLPVLESYIAKRARGLERFFDHILGCRILVELPHLHHQDGKRYHVRIEVTVPGEEVVVSHDAGRGEEHEDAKIAVHQAFAALERRLEDYVRRLHHQTKTHEEHPHGKVLRLIPEDDCGFIETPDGREIYFHRNSVLDGGYDRLEVGAPVWFSEEAGEKGPQASTVHPR